MKRTFARWATFALLALCQPVLAIDRSGCPTKYIASTAIEGVCIHQKLDADVISAATGTGQCESRSYANPPGLNFCLERKTLSISMTPDRQNQHVYLIDGVKTQGSQRCSTGYFDWKKYELCVSDDLAISLEQDTLVLKRPRLKCSSGFEHRPGWKACVSKKAPVDSREVTALQCYAGYTKPEHVDICLQNKIAFETHRYQSFGVTAPLKTCTTNIYHAVDGGFCLPAKTAIFCGPDTFACEREFGDSMRVLQGSGCCENHNTASVMDIPATHASGVSNFAFEPVIVCGCPECGPPAHGENLSCETEPVKF